MTSPTLKRFILLLNSLLFLISCGDSSKQDKIFEHENTNEFYRLTPERQKELAPTDLFKSIYTNSTSDFQEHLTSEDFQFDQLNAEGDSPLAVAIKLKREEMVLALISKATKKDFLKVNSKGRSYISLVVEHDLLEAFDKAYETYFSLAQFAGQIRFSKIDFKDDLGRRASFYAKSYSMFDRLEKAWFTSAISLRHYFNSFYYDEDLEGNTFLHLAAKNQNQQVIYWYVENHCDYREWEESSFPTYVARRLGDAFGDAEWLPFRRRYINRQNDKGNTPLHVAAKFGRYASLTALQSCYQSDPTILNNQKRVAITELLASIDPSLNNVPENYKKTFSYLSNQVDPVWTRADFELSWHSSNLNMGFSIGNNFRRLITKKDSSKWTALHYAAQIRDPYFWNLFSDYQDIKTRNDEGLTPSQLRLQN